MQSVATWLVARPQNAILALAATLLLPLLQIVSGAIMVLLVLRHGVRLAVIEGVIAGLFLVAVAIVVGAPVTQIAVSIVATLLPALLLAVLLHVTRSLALTMQVSAILAALAMLVFQFAVDDIVAFWEPVMAMLVEWTRDNNLQLQAEFLVADPAMTAEMMTLATVLTRWTIFAVYLLLGYRFFSGLPGATENYGRFCDLNFGRVIALIMALASLIAYASDTAWLQNVAVVLFMSFWLQGLAIVHWMHVDRNLPLFVVIATYVLMLILHVFLVLALAVLGYTDAWFRYRRATRQQ